MDESFDRNLVNVSFLVKPIDVTQVAEKLYKNEGVYEALLSEMNRIFALAHQKQQRYYTLSFYQQESEL